MFLTSAHTQTAMELFITGVLRVPLVSVLLASIKASHKLLFQYSGRVVPTPSLFWKVRLLFSNNDQEDAPSPPTG